MATQVVFVPYCGPAVPDMKTTLRRKRKAMWDNTGRNALLAAAAEGLARKPRKVLGGYGVEVKALRLPARTRRRVIVLVESAEHGRRLQKLLPAWELWHSAPAEDGTDAGCDVEEEPNEPPPGVIATLVYAFWNGIGCDILVRATAGTGKLDWDAIRGGSSKSGTGPALVVDIADTSGARERTDSDVRRREYREQGLRELKAVTEVKTPNRNT